MLRRYCTPILTTYVKKSPPELGEALRLIQLLLQQDSNLASEALDYIVFLVDVDKLYDVALGLYDFDLVLMVAQKSQKDPKEYLPFLTLLQKLEPIEFQRYTIDIHLERWDKALENLSKAGDQYFEQCISLTTEHELYEQAIGLFSNNQSAIGPVYAAFGDWLSSQGKLEAAGHAYNLAGRHKKALTAFRDSGKWRGALSAAIRVGYSAEEQRQLAYEMAESLQMVGQHKDAATLLSQHASDPEAAIVALVEGGIWDDAVRLCEIHARVDLITTHVRPSILSASETQLNEIREGITTWSSNTERLKVIRSNKLLLPQYLGSGARPEGDEATTMSGWSHRTGQSVASAASAMSAVSVASSASQDSVVSWHSLSSKGLIQGGPSGRQARHEKKRKQNHRAKGKAGSPHEEEYIVDMLRGLVPTPATQHGIGRLVRMLMHFGLMSTACDVQGSFRVCVQHVGIGQLTLFKKALLLLIQNSLTTVNASVEGIANEQKAPNNETSNKVKLVAFEQISWALDFWDTKK